MFFVDMKCLKQDCTPDKKSTLTFSREKPLKICWLKSLLDYNLCQFLFFTYDVIFDKVTRVEDV